ncbi:hypothetical protein [Streptococcus suis]|uniref:Transmembrane protein n=2 Tax=Streptococcus suis TaxID=1307 RepID=A0A0Z8ESK1_STRSU|nr:hypothetical protein [Streptococcus suis]MBL6515094.1 hypothetical protein [Streptococcus suis]MCK4024098.1 hypothetical protein [Streptococcus suis]MCR1231941.1 hypothetical protein [Streptococcus suis]MDE1693579.1 hypothetical protein [Streptococcus suis]MDG4509788.1 hypothetical protein [Streptococcus suis]
MEQQQSQTVEFSQSWQQEETSQETGYHYTGWDLAKEYLMTFLGWIWTAVVFLIATPVFLVMWCINFIKTLLGMVIFWILGKGAVVVVTMLALAAAEYLNILKEETIASIFESVSGFLFGSTGNEMEILFPHGQIELWLILILSLILATVATIPRSSRY